MDEWAMLAAVDLPGLAAVIAAVAVLVTAVSTHLLARRTHGIVKESAVKIDQVDAAVNGKPPGATTMVQQVQKLTDQAFPPPVDEVDGAAVLPLVRGLALTMAELSAAVKRMEEAQGAD